MRSRSIIGAFAATACTAAVLLLMPDAPAGTLPFLHWRVGVKDAALALVEVECAVTGDLASTFPLFPSMTGTGEPLDPIGLAAYDREG
ncbi:MAG: hypothetical protein PHQ19_04070, partial [Candidatus Krumholzibacteria bacterium]|nr:hypothetical protein [Candidatus Krumholzibacteria bacterium]